MKKSSILIASMAAMLFSFNSFADNGDATKMGPANETEITIATPNDDPNAPPPPPATYYLVKYNGVALNAAEIAYFTGNLYQSTALTTMGPISTTYPYMAISSSDCRTYFMTHPMCTGGCRNGNVLFTLVSPAVTTSNVVFTWGGCPLL